MTTAWLNSKFIEKNDILWVDNLKVIILSVIIRNFVLFCKPILVLNCHSLKHKPIISWNINHKYNFSLTSAIKQDIWYAFSKVSTLSIKIQLQLCSKQANDIGRHTQYIKNQRFWVAGWYHGGNGALQRAVKSVSANNYSHISNSVSFPVFFYWIVDFKLGINFKSGFKRPDLI